MTTEVETKAVPWSRRLRPRLSLLTALLLMTIVGIAIVTARLWREVGPLRAQVFQLRSELGYLSVKDENQIYAIQVSGATPGVSRYRVYLPKNRKFQINTRIFTIPGKLPKQSRQEWLNSLRGSGSYSPVDSGEFTIDILLQPDPNKKDQWLLVYRIQGKGGGTDGTTMPWLKDRRVWSTSSEASLRKQKEISPEEGVVLFAVREGTVKELKGGFSSHPADETKEANGVLLWIAPEVKD